MMRFGTEIDFSISGLTFGAQSVHQFAPDLELVEDGSLTSRVQPNHQNPHLLLGEQPPKHLRAQARMRCEGEGSARRTFARHSRAEQV